MIVCGDCQHRHAGRCDEWGCRCQAPAFVGLDPAGDALVVVAAAASIGVPFDFTSRNPADPRAVRFRGTIQADDRGDAGTRRNVRPPTLARALVAGLPPVEDAE